jgi:sugar O-acyltransferase (sialic acid O-acetyltransferase NeuD family)
MEVGREQASWVIFACRTDYAAEVAEIIWRREEGIELLVDNLPDGPLPSPIGTVVAPSALDPGMLAAPFVIPLTTPGFRFTARAEARRFGARSFPVLGDPTSSIARSAEIDEGSVVNAGVVIGAGTRIGRFVHVNRSASIGHDGVIDDFATLGPACVLSGRVQVQRGAFVGSGAVCAPKVTIGANATVGAGAVVISDVAPETVVVGNPARPIRAGEPGYGGVTVPVLP